MLDGKHIKKDFPVFDHHPDLVYLDSAATALKPRVVVEKMREYYEQYPANIHRGLYGTAVRATEEYESAREVVRGFINALEAEEIIFTHGTTAALNLLARSLEQNIQAGDKIVATVMEHHSNFVPWQELARRTGVDFCMFDIDEGGELMADIEAVSNAKILALALVSNVLGTINPIRDVIAHAKKLNPNIITVVDAAQAAGHVPIDVQKLGCDFLTFSGHKLLGPTGVGVLWGRREALNNLPAYQFGGEMVDRVSVEETTFQAAPYRFEAGTPPIGSVIALQEAINYISHIGVLDIRKHEQELVAYAIQKMCEEFGNELEIYGPKNIKKRGSVISFRFKEYHPHDAAQILDESRVAVRGGHHCAMPLHTRLGIPATVRASVHIYNTQEDIDRFVQGLVRVDQVLGK